MRRTHIKTAMAIRQSELVLFLSQSPPHNAVGICPTRFAFHFEKIHPVWFYSKWQPDSVNPIQKSLREFTVRQTSTRSRAEILPDYQTDTDTGIAPTGL
jgi:hypothetical protein